jgi:hypothetical protein
LDVSGDKIVIVQPEPLAVRRSRGAQDLVPAEQPSFETSLNMPTVEVDQ